MYNGLVNGIVELDALVDAVEDVVETDMAFVWDRSQNRGSSQVAVSRVQGESPGAPTRWLLHARLHRRTTVFATSADLLMAVPCLLADFEKL